MRFDSRLVLVSTALIICLGLAAPATAGNLKVFGAYWDTSDAGSFYGAGARYTFSESLGLSFGLTGYFDGDDLTIDDLSYDAIDNLTWDLGVHVSINELFYFNVGASYYQLDSSFGSIDNEWGYYGLLGATMGGKTFRFFIEGVYRDADATIQYENFDLVVSDLQIDLSGFAVNAGLEWRF